MEDRKKKEKRREAETSEAMRRTPRGYEKRMKREKKRRSEENSEMMRGISKKLRRSRRKVEKLEITLLSLNAGRKSQAKKLGIYAM